MHETSGRTKNAPCQPEGGRLNTMHVHYNYIITHVKTHGASTGLMQSPEICHPEEALAATEGSPYRIGDASLRSHRPEAVSLREHDISLFF